MKFNAGLLKVESTSLFSCNTRCINNTRHSTKTISFEISNGPMWLYIISWHEPDNIGHYTIFIGFSEHGTLIIGYTVAVICE